MDLADLFSGGRKNYTSSQVAKERMKFVLVHDRADIPLETMEKMKNDIIEVISRYVNIDPDDVAIDFNHQGREQRLVADIPIKRGARKN